MHHRFSTEVLIIICTISVLFLSMPVPFTRICAQIVSCTSGINCPLLDAPAVSGRYFISFSSIFCQFSPFSLQCDRKPIAYPAPSYVELMVIAALSRHPIRSVIHLFRREMSIFDFICPFLFSQEQFSPDLYSVYLCGPWLCI